MLLVYSDGLIESENAQGEDYGIERLRASVQDGGQGLSDEAAVRLCRHNLSDYLGGTRVNDALTVVAIRRSPLADSTISR